MIDSNRKRYIAEFGYYLTQHHVWFYTELLYDTEIDAFVNPDGSVCDRVRNSIPYGEVSLHAHDASDDIESTRGKANNEKPVPLPKGLLDLINSEYEFYEDNLQQYLNE